MMDDLDDSLDDLLGGYVVGPAKAPPANYKPMDYSEPCKKCGGSGRFRNLGQCFACKGKGKLEFKTSPASRAQNRASSARTKANKIEAFKAEHPDVWAWMDGSTFVPAIEMRNDLEKYGSLFESRVEFAKRMIAKREEKRAEKAAANAPALVEAAGVDRLKAAFDTAKARAVAKGLKMRTPRITIGGVVISPAPATGKNPGAIYVKEHGEYLGKIADGKFYAVPSCDAATKAKVMEFIADPKAAAEAYGQTTGTCCICNATLVSKWKERGIGPICAQKYGW
jgi:hypothetical protein